MWTQPMPQTITHLTWTLTTDIDDIKELHNKCKPKIQVFKGFNDKISIENWLKRFEMIAKHLKWSDNDKLVLLGNYLEDDALNWYIENSCDNYSQVKDRLINRFGVETADPIVEFVTIRYDIKLGIKDYFERKRRFGNLAKLTVEQMIPLMINNLHPRMIESFIAVKPKTLTQFYNIAQSAETNLKRFTNRPVPMSDKQKQFNSSQTKPAKRKPPNPCRICENIGYKNRYHWSNDCRNRGKPNISQNVSQTKAINSLQVNADVSSEENDITNIEI